MGLGGPVWHASTANAPRAMLRLVALNALAGVGDEALGQWEDWTGKAYHVRRRLTPTEQSEFGIEEVKDIRGTVEATMRLEPVRRILPRNWPEYHETAFGGRGGSGGEVGGDWRGLASVHEKVI